MTAAACKPETPPDSGIEGLVSIGPVSPVSQPGEPDSRPYSAELSIIRLSDGEEIARVTSADDGRFRVPLAPGRCLVEPQQGQPFPTAPSQEVTVDAGRFTRIQVDYDSGIR